MLCYGLLVYVETLRLQSKDDILDNREGIDQHEMLMNHSDSMFHGIEGRAQVDALSLDEDLALVGVVNAVKHIHERRLPCPVLAEQCMNFSLTKGKAHVVIRHDAWKTLGDIIHDEHQLFLAVHLFLQRKEKAPRLNTGEQ